MKNNFLVGYFILLHLFLVFILVKTDFISRVGYRLGIIKPDDPELNQHFRKMKIFLERVDANTPDGVVYFIGDSGIQGLCVSAVANPSVNYGIGSDTTVGVLERLPHYHSLKKASACVISIGGNDLKRRNIDEIVNNYNKIVQSIPPHLPLVICAVLPVDEIVRNDLAGMNERREKLNNSLRAICADIGDKCAFVDPGPKLVDSSGNLLDKYHIGDGLHLNGNGNSIWIKELKGIVQGVQQTASADAADPPP